MAGCDFCSRGICKTLMRVRSGIITLGEEEVWAESGVCVSDDSLELTLDNAGAALTHTIGINFCPMCGRKLKEDNE